MSCWGLTKEVIYMDWKPLSRDAVAIRLKAEPEFVTIEGNAMASGDDAFDQEVENNILSHLEQNDIWA